MDFVIHAMGLAFNGDTIKQKSLGGSESAAYYLARCLAKRGHRVKVFTGEQSDTVTEDGVQYIWHGPAHERAPLGERFAHYAGNTPHDVLIIQRHPLGFQRDYASKLNIWQLHDVALFRSAKTVQGNVPRLHMVTTVSDWHKEQVQKVYGINPEIMRTVPNGVDSRLYNDARKVSDSQLCKEAQMVKDCAQIACLYQSRPERGLEHLLRPGGIMERLQGKAHLFVCGYDNTVPEMRGYYGQLEAWANALPNVTSLGSLTKAKLAEVQTRCDLLLYPTEFEEVSCITAMEAMHAHLPILSSGCGALVETCKDTGTILLDLKDGRADEDAFVAKMEELVADHNNLTREGPSMLAQLAEKQIASKQSKTWDAAVEVLLQHIHEAFGKATPTQLIRHYIRHGDIIAAEHETASIEAGDGIGQAAIRELKVMYEFSQPGNEVALKEHYARWEANNIEVQGGEDTLITTLDHSMHTARFSGIAQFVEQAIQQRGAKRILEFGSSYGHIIIALARLFPEVQFVGIDFVAQSIRLARKHAIESNVSNVEFIEGDLAAVKEAGMFDCILAAEVIEHIRDYHGALNALREQLRLGGSLVLTTPAGRWEWNSPENFRKFREHLHHFERQDFAEILGPMKYEIIYAPGGTDHAHGVIGSWVTNVIPMDTPFSVIDYNRKRSETAPRQTVSLCMILKDAESTIRKSLVSVIDYVDEVVVAVDPATTDRTRVVLASMQADHPMMPFTVFDGVKAVVDGFDAARNLTVDKASGDWIMWMDADEEVSGADNIDRVMQPSSHNAYGTPQIHYATQPAQVLTTDYPCRLFRNRRGVKFYGLVHEHPEEEPGKSIKQVAVLPDVMFAHYGYINENVRRRRFQRNYPLLLRDIAKYPTRILNKFLFLRDIAQGIGFEREQGVMNVEQMQQAERGCALFGEIVEMGHTRMIVDALPFYTVCVEVLGEGFEAEVAIASTKPGLPELSYAVRAKSRFRNEVDYLKIINKLAQESTTNYDSRYA